MKQNTDTLYTVITGGTMASVAFLFGGIDQLLTALAVFMAVDYLTGIISGFQEKTVSSKRALKGLGKKGAMLSLVIISNQLDIITGNESHFMRNSMIFFLIATEGISIVENLGKLGINVPQFLSDRFEQMKNTKGEDK